MKAAVVVVVGWPIMVESGEVVMEVASVAVVVDSVVDVVEAVVVVVIGMYSVAVVVGFLVVVAASVDVKVASGKSGGNVTPDIEAGIVNDPFRPTIGNCGTVGAGRGEITGTRLPSEEFGTS